MFKLAAGSLMMAALAFVGAQPGRWRVWAVDKEGREGFKSPWRLFVYLG